MSKLSLNLGITYLGILVCIGRLAYQPDYSILVGLALFITNLNLRKFFLFLKKSKKEESEGKLLQLTKRVSDMDHEMQKLILAANFKGVIR